MCVKWRRAVLVAGRDPNNNCNHISTAVTQSFSVNKNMTLAATISVEGHYTPDDIRLSLDKIRLNGRSLFLYCLDYFTLVGSIGVRIFPGGALLLTKNVLFWSSRSFPWSYALYIPPSTFLSHLRGCTFPNSPHFPIISTKYFAYKIFFRRPAGVHLHPLATPMFRSYKLN